jgi:hypothetical protein
MGGTYDPETGQIVWEFHVPLKEQLRHYASHPPSCLSSLRCTPTELPGFTFDGHGEPVNVVFAVACVCGGSSFTVMGYLVEGELPEPPITLECDECEAEHMIFDARRHGYDGTVGGMDIEPEGEPRELFWDELEPPHAVLIRFEYPSDVLGDEQWQGKEHDLFGWITVVGRGAHGSPTLLFDYECA